MSHVRHMRCCYLAKVASEATLSLRVSPGFVATMQQVTRVVDPASCFAIYDLRCDFCALTVVLVAHVTSLRVECSRR